MDLRSILFASVLSSLSLACTSEGEAIPPTQPAEPAPVSAAPAPVSTAQEPTVAKTGLNLAAQPGWITQAPSSSMRKAQFLLPKADGDAEDASLVVYYFGGQGGSREANLERWAGQFEQPDGGSSSEEMQHETRRIRGLEVLDATLSGTYVAETAPGSGERVRKPSWRMLAAIVENEDGPWYVKLVGPEKTVAHWEQSYRKFVDSMPPAQ